MSVSSSPPPIGLPTKFASLFSHAKHDLPAGLVVFLVATPLCLGIAQASGAPLLSGLIAGMIGGLVVAAISKAPLSVSGPAAGLAVIVATGIQELGFRDFLAAVVIAGVLQVLLGTLRLGVIAHFFPSAVIKGMLAAIGILIVLKQVPHAVGYDRDWQGDESFSQADGGNTFSSIFDALGAFTPAAVVITIACALCYVVWPRLQRGPLKQVPTPLVAVVVGGVLVATLPLVWQNGVLAKENLVTLPVYSSFGDVMEAIITPSWAAFTSVAVWKTGATIAIVASIETLLSIEAIDRLDPQRRLSPTNRELVAQGVGNTVSGLIGGLPITSVIVRSSANLQAGGKTRLSAMVHGVLLLIGVVLLPSLLNQVPLAALAVVLIVVGTKLSTPKLWLSMWRQGYEQFIPFLVTVVAVVFTDLLKGTMLGMFVGLCFVFRHQQEHAIVVAKQQGSTFISFVKDMTFMQKARIKSVLRDIKDGETVVIDREHADFIDDDIEEVLAEFAHNAKARNITLEENLTPKDIERRRHIQIGH